MLAGLGKLKIHYLTLWFGGLYSKPPVPIRSHQNWSDSDQICSEPVRTKSDQFLSGVWSESNQKQARSNESHDCCYDSSFEFCSVCWVSHVTTCACQISTHSSVTRHITITTTPQWRWRHLRDCERCDDAGHKLSQPAISVILASHPVILASHPVIQAILCLLGALFC